MKLKNLLLLGYAVIVLVPVILVWTMAWPILKPVPFPVTDSGRLVVPVERSLNSEEVRFLDQWVRQHKTAWGTKGEQAPGLASARFVLEGKNHEKFYLSLWHFRHGDDVAGFQNAATGPYRMRSLNKGELAPLMKLFSDLPWKAKK
ncbi:hypothetical protein [Aristophania vespae]|uniref:hypothetical protein n=1 Tax=Aristophania vespae TaxID=2697033 RepID=UPI00235179D4|nr:hypothetical protein [Aristophania vespae]UMM64690.1 hypothetical protein DM15PD_17070 [Aristophania vespae]